MDLHDDSRKALQGLNLGQNLCIVVLLLLLMGTGCPRNLESSFGSPRSWDARCCHGRLGRLRMFLTIQCPRLGTGEGAKE